MAPIIIEAINKSDGSQKIYNDIYDNVIKTCIYAIENGSYPCAYELYKNSILNLEEEIARLILK